MEKRNTSHLLILFGITLFFGLLAIFYFYVPIARYVLIPYLGSVKVPVSILNTIPASIQLSPEQKKKNQQYQFKVGTFADSKTVVNSISKVPQEKGWINTSPLNIKKIINDNKVILIDFWTFSCINCIRATPYTVELWNRYKDHGLVVIGVHSPEFNFERNPYFIYLATKRLKITYPVLTDANKVIWKAFGNVFWPAKYVISPKGYAVYTRFGEGDYAYEEKMVRKALKNAGWKLPPAKPTSVYLTPNSKSETRELHAGPGFIKTKFGNKNQPKQGKEVLFSIPGKIKSNKIYVQGDWFGAHDYIESLSDGKIVLYYLANTPYIVLEPAKNPIYVSVLFNKKPIPKQYWGKDIVLRNGKTSMLIDTPRLYFPLSSKTPYGNNLIGFDVPKGVRFYSFTFGSYD
jgi:thiol-disulfide isomerase/thioredoxin